VHLVPEAAQLDALLDTKGVLQVAVAKVPQRERFPAFVQDFVEYEQEAVTLLLNSPSWDCRSRLCGSPNTRVSQVRRCCWRHPSTTISRTWRPG
jgi:hypothetical protein